MEDRQNELEQAFTYCDQFARQNSENLYYIFSRLPQLMRRDIYVIYAYYQAVYQGTISYEIQNIQQIMDHALMHPVLWALDDVIRRHAIPVQFFVDMADGIRMRKLQHSFNSFEELQELAWKNSSAPLLAAFYVMGFDNEKNIRNLASLLGSSMFLTQVLRDIRVWIHQDKLLFAKDEMEHFGFGEGDLLVFRDTPQLRRFFLFQIERIKSMLQLSETYREELPVAIAGVARMIDALYGEMVNQMQDDPRIIFEGDTQLAPLQKLMLSASVEKIEQSTEPLSEDHTILLFGQIGGVQESQFLQWDAHQRYHFYARFSKQQRFSEYLVSQVTKAKRPALSCALSFSLAIRQLILKNDISWQAWEDDFRLAKPKHPWLNDLLRITRYYRIPTASMIKLIESARKLSLQKNLKNENEYQIFLQQYVGPQIHLVTAILEKEINLFSFKQLLYATHIYECLKNLNSDLKAGILFFPCDEWEQFDCPLNGELPYAMGGVLQVWFQRQMERMNGYLQEAYFHDENKALTSAIQWFEKQINELKRRPDQILKPRQSFFFRR